MTNPVFNGMGNVFLRALGDVALVTYNKAGGGSVDIRIIFNEGFIENDKNGVPYTTPQPMAWLKTSDVSDAQAGDTFTHAGQDWEVRAAEPDALEMTKLILSRA